MEMIRPQTCPVCDKELAIDAGRNSANFPFCSERCRHVDFFRWSEGKYAIADPLDPGYVDPESGPIENQPPD
jgi:hypothetical protein